MAISEFHADHKCELKYMHGLGRPCLKFFCEMTLHSWAFPTHILCFLLLDLAEGFILHVLCRLRKYHRICNAFTKLPTIKPGTSLKKCDSQDFCISNHMQNKLVYLASLAYGMEILS